MREASRLGETAAVVQWGELALSDVRGQLTEEENVIVVDTLRRILRPGSANQLLFATSEAANSEPEYLSPQQKLQRLIGSQLRQGKATAGIDDFLLRWIDMAQVPVSEQVTWLHLLESEGKFESALKIARQLPRPSNSHHLQANLLERMGRFGEAAAVLETQAPEAEKEDPAYWKTLLTLYEQAGDREQMVSVLFRAHYIILADPELMSIASSVLLDEASRVEFHRQENRQENRREQQQDNRQNSLDSQRLVLRELFINLDEAVETETKADTQRETESKARHVDTEIALASRYLNQREEQIAWDLIEGILTTSTVNFDQANALAQIVWGLGRCGSILDPDVMSHNVQSAGLLMLQVSCYRRRGEFQLSLESIDEILTDTTLALEDQLVLLRMKGYLLVELGRGSQAVDIWKPLLESSLDPVLVVSAAYAASSVSDWDQVEMFLAAVEPETMPVYQRSTFWQVSASLAAAKGDLKGATAAYEQALLFDPLNGYLWERLAAAAEASGETKISDEGWQKFVELSEVTSTNHAAYAYYLKRHKRPAEAVRQFKEAIKVAPDRIDLRRDLVYTLLTTRETDEAEVILKEIIDQDDGTDQKTHYQDQLTLAEFTRRATFEFNDVARLNTGLDQIGNPAIRNSSYHGYGSVSGTYLPLWAVDEGGAQRIELNGRMFWSQDDRTIKPISETLVLSTGIRLRLLTKYAVFTSVERLVAIGDQAEDDTLARISGSFFSGLGWPFGEDAWWRQNLYLDAAYFLESGVEYYTVDYEQGRVFRMGGSNGNWALMPSFRIGGSAHNDNFAGDRETRVDVGIRLSILGRHHYDVYEAHQVGTRASIGFSYKIGGNTEDVYAAHLRFRFNF